MKRFFCICVFLLIIISFYGCENRTNVVMTIGSEKVSEAEFQYYFYLQQKNFVKVGSDDIWMTDFDGVPSETVAKEQSISAITRVKVSVLNASSYNIVMTDEDKNKAKNAAEKDMANNAEIYDDFNIDENLLVQIMEDNVYYDKLYTFITKNYVISENDFAKYYEEYVDGHNSEVEKESESDNGLDGILTVDEVEEMYIQSKKDEIFFEQYDKWLENTNIEINRDIIKDIDILKY